jgi:hypothetical protein
MSTVTLTDVEQRELYDEDSTDKYVLLHKGEFEQDGKNQYCEVIFQDRASEKTYRLWVGREGSPFTDWYYTFGDNYTGGVVETCHEVERREVVVTKWVVKKDELI